jgi:ABC-type transport system substrate-binding protein
MKKTILVGFSMLIVIAMLLPTVFAFEYGNPAHPDDASFETFGPRCDNLLIQLYASETSEWDALEAHEIDVTDWPLDAEHYIDYSTPPLNEDIKVISYGPEFGLFLFDLNNNNNVYLGNPEDPAYPNPVYPNPMSVVELRKAVAYLSDRTYVINEVIGEGFAFPVYTPMSPASGFYMHPEIRPGGALQDLCYLYDPNAAIDMLDDSGKFPIGLDGWRYWDMDLDGVKDEGENMVLKIFARSETPPRLKIAEKLYGLLENTTKIHVNWVPGNRAAALVQVMGNKDFHIYTAGWSLTMDPDHLVLWHWDYYWHPGQCYNTVGANIPEFNGAADGVQYANTIEEATYWAHIAQEAFAEYCIGVPLWSAGGNKAVHRWYTGNTVPEEGYHGRWWRNFVNIPGFGVDNGFTFMSMRPCEISPRAAGSTIRYGFKTDSLNSLNPIYTNWLWDNTVIDLVGYESLLYREPYTRIFKPWLCDSFVVGTWDDGSGPYTAINFTMRRPAFWSDGTPITFEDINYTFVQLKYDLAARGLPDPWWISNVQNIIQMIKHSATLFEVRLDVKSVFAVGWIGGNRILPKHIWEPICKGLPRPIDGAAWDPTTFAPDINLIHSGAWCFVSYAPQATILLTAHKPGTTVTTSGITDPNWQGSIPITSTNGFFRYFRDEDLNKDDKVNILDAILLAGKFGKKEGDVGYSRVIDINGDGKINILDAIRLAGYFGWPNLEKVECAAYGGPWAPGFPDQP